MIVRKVAPALLACIMLFNTIGYRLFVSCLQNHNDQQLEIKFDNSNYDDESLVEIKIPVNLPYQINRPEYERFDGEIEVDGILYKYVKRKVENDTLFLQCIPNTAKMNLTIAVNKLFKSTAGLDDPGVPMGAKSAIVVKKLFTEYDDSLFSYRSIRQSTPALAHALASCSTGLASRPHTSPEQPPEQPSA
ncbi:hypothetical protein EXU57_04420 [Segetibacter sp. 3557_3]|uniref:hypothetical protein n=1 Tax=Segetibacter sp. 3557_3 TaxID=2547429 RepID=UPI00105902AC|nr:hypothetical protein [Segetibacter sp. 3557_3]TDH29314.1 hypothetical protein EXU57_04420 [Segetibacter sp. 3557_3]